MRFTFEKFLTVYASQNIFNVFRIFCNVVLKYAAFVLSIK